MWKIVDTRNENEVKKYEKFVREHKNGWFTQSISWAEFKSNWLHEAVIITGVNGDIKGAALILIKKIPIIGRSFFYCPRGPVCNYDDKETLSEILEAVAALGKKYKAYQFRTDPPINEEKSRYIDLFEDLGFSYKENASELSTIQARTSYMLYFKGRNKEEIFESFHSKWRYNIRLASRKGVECRVCGKEAVDDFYALMEETGERDNFCIRGKRYFEDMLDELGDQCRLYMCYCRGVPLSGAVCVRYAGKSHYVYGASTARMRNVMPNYLMQWTMISDAVDSGCYVHDFMGIPFYKNPEHPNYGVYRFKRGFNGEVVTFAGEFDIRYRPFISRLSDVGFFLVRQYRKLQSFMIRHKVKFKPENQMPIHKLLEIKM